jgi:hypothetical protein
LREKKITSTKRNGKKKEHDNRLHGSVDARAHELLIYSSKAEADDRQKQTITFRMRNAVTLFLQVR